MGTLLALGFTFLQLPSDLVIQASAGTWHLVPLVLAEGNLALRSLPGPSVPTHSMMSITRSPLEHETCFSQHQELRSSSHHLCPGALPSPPGWSPLAGGPELPAIASAWRRPPPSSWCHARPGSAPGTGSSSGIGGNVPLCQQHVLAPPAWGHPSLEPVGRGGQGGGTEPLPHLQHCALLCLTLQTCPI